jgi:hypothetical protein
MATEKKLLEEGKEARRRKNDNINKRKGYIAERRAIKEALKKGGARKKVEAIEEKEEGKGNGRISENKL